MELNEEEVVYLKSGSPPMTIYRDTEGDGFLCQWFEGDELREKEFYASQLTNERPNFKKAATKKVPAKKKK